MDIDEWEFISHDAFHDFNEDGEKQIFLWKKSLESKVVLDMDYFCPSRSSRKMNEQQKNPRV
ncbi:unnamed protein product [Lupinus luteus]|uniref:Uncharacterized protein n=1 Tax=Lupinus luteus TaxID=3873 RepID=A0AAV1X696_LUPLU